MSKYIYEVTGDYKDCLKMKKGNIIIHDGSLIGLISYSHNRLELRLNYGKKFCSLCEMKKKDNYVIVLPITEYMEEDSYSYIPLIFNQEEYEELIEISYIDKELLSNMQEVNKQDIYNMIIMEFKLEFGLSDILYFKDILENIIAFSEDDIKLEKCINNIKINDRVKIQKLNKDDLKHITLYIDFSNNLFEWSCIIKSDNKFYFKLTDEYALEIS